MYVIIRIVHNLFGTLPLRRCVVKVDVGGGGGGEWQCTKLEKYRIETIQHSIHLHTDY